MAVTGVRGRQYVAPAVPGWSLVALAAAVLGVAAAAVLVLAQDSDPGSVRWWLIVLPVFLALVPVLAPSRLTRIAAAVFAVCWCVVTGFTIGFLLIPAAVALFLATKDDG